ncbi:MAG: zinc ABC transporter substrate-binding protein [Lachnospiraceae bacterium]|nr:zinc ABC transporter substrate-binding protein [Lachnospiraceae bacterium]
MKKILSILLILILSVGCLSACGSNGGRRDGKLRIVATIFPEYDWVKSILGDRAADVELTLLLDNGVDLHSYQPTADDILTISDCDLFIYVGGESDRWVEDALKNPVNKNRVVINLMEVLGSAVKEEEIVEGMQEEHEHDHEDGDHDHDHEDGDDEDGNHEDGDHDHDEEGPEYDEHVWLSLRNAAIIVKSLSESLQKLDPDHAETYRKNTEDYLAKLAALDGQYKAAVEGASVKTLLFGDRFPFRYMTDDYGLKYYAAFVGCSAESEASFETIAFLSEKVDELSLRSVITIEGTDHRIAETIIRNTKTKDQRILVLDSLQSAKAEDIKNGVTYLSVMEKNLNVLKEALR